MLSFITSTVVFSLLLTPGAETSGAAKAPVDLILVNAKIWTVDKSRPEAEALAVWRDRIVSIGSNAEIRALAGPQTRVLDGQGRRVVPGFYDSHVHLLGSG